MPIYGIVAQESLGAAATAPTNNYVASAVTFDGSTTLELASLGSVNNAFFSFAGWFKTDWTANTFPTAFMIDIVNQGGPFFGTSSGDIIQFWVSNDGSGGFHNRWIGTSNLSAPGNSTAWTHIIGSMDAQNGLAKMYFNDTNAGGVVNGAFAFDVSSNGLQLLIGGDTFAGDEYIGDICDLSIWPGTSFLTAGDITLTTRRFFRDAGGLPIDPTIYIAQFGTPPIMLSGNAANFLTNSLGSSGSLSYLSGALTNAATHP